MDAEVEWQQRLLLLGYADGNDSVWLIMAKKKLGRGTKRRKTLSEQIK